VKGNVFTPNRQAFSPSIVIPLIIRIIIINITL
jgi:hypothetical protein